MLGLRIDGEGKREVQKIQEEGNSQAASHEISGQGNINQKIGKSIRGKRRANPEREKMNLEIERRRKAKNHVNQIKLRENQARPRIEEAVKVNQEIKEGEGKVHQ